jgi:SRSO17 transposase
LNYVSPLGAALLDCELYLPQEWTNNPNRRRQALIPDEIQFTPKPQLAQAMLDRSLEMGLPFAWVTGSADYGNDACLRGWLAEKGLPFLFEVSPEIFHLPEHLDSQLAQTGLDGLITNLAKTDWKQLPYEENFAARLPAYEWSMVPIETSYEKPGWQNWLLVRRNPAQPLELKYFLVFGAAATTLRELVRIESQRWLRETAWQTLRSKIGLDQYEVRSWQGWYRHITLALVAYAYQVTKPIKI